MRNLPFKIFIAVLILAGNLSAQDFRQDGTNFSYREGDWVSYSVGRFVSSIAIGRRYIYFGTEHSGIARLDQYSFRWEFPWTTSNGLADNRISVVAYDFDTSHIWCASEYAFSVYNATSQKWRNFYKSDYGFSNEQIHSIGVGDKIYFEAASGRIIEIDKYGNFVDRGNSLPPDLKWFGRRGQSRTELPHFFMSGDYLFTPGRMATNFNNGIDGATAAVQDFNFRSSPVVAALDDQWDNLWLATWGAGVGKADVRTLRLEMMEFGLGTPVVEAIAFHDDLLWVGGARTSEEINGITAWDPERQIWQVFREQNFSLLRTDEITGIAADQNGLWFATKFGLANYSTQRGEWSKFDRFDGLSDNVVFDVVADDSTIWIGTERGLDFLPLKNIGLKDTNRVRNLRPDDFDFTEVRELTFTGNLLWAATSTGIYVYDTVKKTGGFTTGDTGPVTHYINAISGYGNRVWVGSDFGIEVYDTEKKKWLGPPEGRFFPDTQINEILATADAVWAGTDEGLMKYNPETRYWRTFTMEDGLLDNRVHALALDGDYLWIGTELGLTRFFWNDPNRID